MQRNAQPEKSIMNNQQSFSLGNIFTKNRVALVSLGINYCRNLTNNKCVEIIGSNKKRDIFNSLKKLGLDSTMFSVSPSLLLNADDRYLHLSLFNSYIPHL